MNTEFIEKLMGGFDLNSIKFDYLKNAKSIFDSDNFLKITPYNGFDSNPDSGRQNNYAWAFCDFNDYIYVGTGRNLPMAALAMIKPGVIVPPKAFTPDVIDMAAEIWRYKKDGSLPWERVYKSDVDPKDPNKTVIGIRSLIVYESDNLKPAMYAAAYSMGGVKILKSHNGKDWTLLETNIPEATSSRTMMVFNGRLYMAAMADGADVPSLLYSSVDPEGKGWTLETPEGEEGKNPMGEIWAIKVYNNKIYLGTASEEGFMLWRTNGSIPKKDDWTLVIDKGAGDAANAYAMSLEVFNDYLYVGTAADTTSTASATTYIIPKGAELIRVDKKDNWQIIMGGPPLKSTTPSKGRRNHPLSNYGNGFNNPYNLYLWQVKVFNNKLYIGTYDPSVSVSTTLEFLEVNKEVLSEYMPKKIMNLAILLLKAQVKVLSKIQFLFGSDLYVSEDGINFKPINVNGFGNQYNYGIRNIFVSNDNTMYIGTANPFQGCEVYKYLDDKEDPDCKPEKPGKPEKHDKGDDCMKDYKYGKYHNDDDCMKEHKFDKYSKDDDCEKDYKYGNHDKDDDCMKEHKYGKHHKDDDYEKGFKYGKHHKDDDCEKGYKYGNHDKDDDCEEDYKCGKYHNDNDCMKEHKYGNHHKDDDCMKDYKYGNHKKIDSCKDDERHFKFFG